MTNSSYRIAPWADALFAMDTAWWDAHIAHVRGCFTGELVTQSAQCNRHGLRPVRESLRDWSPVSNSGAGAVLAAALAGATRVVLLGYDCQHTNGQTHWHGNHPKGLGNAGSVKRWPTQFKALLPRLRGAQVVNCSRETALDVFPRGRLEECLAS